MKNRNLRNLKSIARRAADGLGAADVTALVARAARPALAAVADALSSKRVGEALVDESATIAGAEMRLIDVEEANLLISSRTRTGRKEELLTSDELAVRAGLKTRRSVHDWLRKGKIVG